MCSKRRWTGWSDSCTVNDYKTILT
jgi:hypothetical protein